MKTFFQKYGLWVALLVVLVVKGETLYNLVIPSPSFTPSPEVKVVMFSTAWCGYCKKMRRFLVENKVPFIEHDIESSEENLAMYEQLGVSGVPVVLVNGEVVAGYNPRKVARLAAKEG